MLGTVEILLIICGLIICLLYYYLTASYNFWKKFNIPGPTPILFFGTMKDVILGKVLIGEYLKNLYDAYENTPFVGIFNMREPILMIKDPEYIKDVFIKDAELFPHRGDFTVEVELINHSIFLANGTIAHHLKSKISPILTPNKLKNMFHMILKSMERLDNYIEKLLRRNSHEINCSDMTFKLTLDMAGNIFLGIDLKTLTKGTIEGNEIFTFYKMMRGTFWSYLTKTIMRKTSSQLYNWINNYLFNDAKTTQNLIDFIFNIMKYREEYGFVKSDAINIIMELKKNHKHFAEILGTTNITDEFIAAQVYALFYAGYESSGMTISFTLYELALNQNVQDKLREEIRDMYARNNNEMHFESINTMPYLIAVIKETLRKYPIANSIQREALSSYTFKNTNITVPKNQKIVIPLYAFSYDPKIYPQPEIYNPKRFMDQTEQNSKYFFSFGHGPRSCIGERLGMLQVKIALIGILHNYKFDVCEKTVTSFKYYSTKLVEIPDEDIFLKMTKIN
ncbi:cytochrome P450 6B5-like [Odontomachus brunneus]|uniref:cytochrome P450 6B5-like n=1 Tax=Odontomachus brunneus TaxID=486640 RepID=UPI0013F214DD|nr:cytochrome P450 6B5-like [Odontomachus brunneus]